MSEARPPWANRWGFSDDLARSSRTWQLGLFVISKTENRVRSLDLVGARQVVANRPRNRPHPSNRGYSNATPIGQAIRVRANFQKTTLQTACPTHDRSMTNQSSTSKNPSIPQVGGLSVTWYLGDEPNTFTNKAGEVKTVVELRDPARLANSITIWLDGDGSKLAGVVPGTLVSIHLTSVRSGRGRSELVANVEPATVEEAFNRARS